MSHRLRVIVADDEPDMLDYFQKMLPRLGHRVVAVAENGRELVRLCEEHQPDFAILDVKMPEMDGIQAAIAIFQRRPIPIILVSAHCDPELIARAEADHVMGFLVKPIKAADLQAAIPIAAKRFQQIEDLKRAVDDLRSSTSHRDGK